MDDWAGVRLTLAVALLIFLTACGGGAGTTSRIISSPAVTVSANNLDFGAQRR